MKEYIDHLTIVFQNHKDEAIAKGQKAYMREQFEFYGIKTPIRREIQKPFLDKLYLPQKDELKRIVQALWSKPQREFQLFAQELVFCYSNSMEKNDVKLFEYMATHKSWWDTVDFIATKLMGEYFKIYKEERNHYVEQWLASGNIWLQRCAILFQLKYKKDLDTQLLSYTITYLLGSKEFFINKAIGWILREYSKTNPEWVIDFVDKHSHLSPLSKREALKRLK